MTASKDGKRGAKGRRPTLRKRYRLWRNRVTRRAAARLGPRTVRLIARTCRTSELGREHRVAAEEEHGGALLLALWHGRALLAATIYGTEQTAVLVSESDDGTFATRILHAFGYDVIRGSTAKGGVRALREMISSLRGGKHLVITPDGPLGPMHSMSAGVAFLARATGAPVLPVGFAIDRAWRLRTWDSFAIPKPRAHVVACYGRAVAVAREATNAELADASNAVREELRAAERRAFAHLGLEPDWSAAVPDAPLEPVQ